MYGPCLCGVQEQWLHRVPDFLSLSVLCRHQEETSVMWRGHQDRGLDCSGDYKAFVLDDWELVAHNSPLVEFSSFSRYLDRKLTLAGHWFQYFFTMSCQRETNQMSKTNLLFSASGSNLQRSGHPPFRLFLTTLLQIVSFHIGDDFVFTQPAMVGMTKGGGVWGLHLSNPIGQKTGYWLFSFLLVAAVLPAHQRGLHEYIFSPPSVK